MQKYKRERIHENTRVEMQTKKNKGMPSHKQTLKEGSIERKDNENAATLPPHQTNGQSFGINLKNKISSDVQTLVKLKRDIVKQVPKNVWNGFQTSMGVIPPIMFSRKEKKGELKDNDDLYPIINQTLTESNIYDSKFTSPYKLNQIIPFINTPLVQPSSAIHHTNQNYLDSEIFNPVSQTFIQPSKRDEHEFNNYQHISFGQLQHAEPTYPPPAPPTPGVNEISYAGPNLPTIPMSLAQTGQEAKFIFNPAKQTSVYTEQVVQKRSKGKSYLSDISAFDVAEAIRSRSSDHMRHSPRSFDTRGIPSISTLPKISTQPNPRPQIQKSINNYVPINPPVQHHIHHFSTLSPIQIVVQTPSSARNTSPGYANENVDSIFLAVTTISPLLRASNVNISLRPSQHPLIIGPSTLKNKTPITLHPDFFTLSTKRPESQTTRSPLFINYSTRFPSHTRPHLKTPRGRSLDNPYRPKHMESFLRHTSPAPHDVSSLPPLNNLHKISYPEFPTINGVPYYPVKTIQQRIGNEDFSTDFAEMGSDPQLPNAKDLQIKSNGDPSSNPIVKRNLEKTLRSNDTSYQTTFSPLWKNNDYLSGHFQTTFSPKLTQQLPSDSGEKASSISTQKTNTNPKVTQLQKVIMLSG